MKVCNNGMEIRWNYNWPIQIKKEIMRGRTDMVRVELVNIQLVDVCVRRVGGNNQKGRKTKKKRKNESQEVKKIPIAGHYLIGIWKR